MEYFHSFLRLLCKNSVQVIKLFFKHFLNSHSGGAQEILAQGATTKDPPPFFLPLPEATLEINVADVKMLLSSFTSPFTNRISFVLYSLCFYSSFLFERISDLTSKIRSLALCYLLHPSLSKPVCILHQSYLLPGSRAISLANSFPIFVFFEYTELFSNNLKVSYAVACLETRKEREFVVLRVLWRLRIQFSNKNCDREVGSCMYSFRIQDSTFWDGKMGFRNGSLKVDCSSF